MFCQSGTAEIVSRTPKAASPPAEEFDHEIANIYSEEATELLEAAETSLTAWNRDRKDKERVAELQRQLHTLKGGARMAGISAMGDLSHELETLVIQIDGGSVRGDDHAQRFVADSQGVSRGMRAKDIVRFKHKKKGKYYGGNVRQTLCLHKGEIKLKPADHPDYEVYIQSTSVNRKMTKKTKVLYL